MAKEIYKEYNVPFKIINLNSSLSSKFSNLDEIENFYEWTSKKVNFNEILFLKESFI